MSIYYHIDSTWRDRVEFPNPAEFQVSVNVANSWYTGSRSVQAVRPHNQKQVVNMMYSIKLLHLSIPSDFGGVVGPLFADSTPFFYIGFHSVSTPYSDAQLINTLNTGTNSTGNRVSLKEAVFVAYIDKIQGDFLYYKTNGMVQTYRFNPKDAIDFKLFTNDGESLQIVDSPASDPIMADRQVSALFEVTPYIREDKYDNHLVDIYNMP